MQETPITRIWMTRRIACSVRIVDDRSAYLPVDKQVIETGEVVETLESLLRPL